MDLIETWSTKIAAAVAPAEADLAPLMAEAYLAGGKPREQLFLRSEGGGLGGFGASEVQAVFPVVLQSIVATGSVLVAILASPATKNLLSLVDSYLKIEDRFGRPKPAPAAPDRQQYAALNQLIDHFSAGLSATGLPQEKRDLLAYRFMKTLLEDPQSAQEYIRTICAAEPAGKEKPAPDQKTGG